MASYDLPSSAPEKVDMRDVLWPVEDTGQIFAAPASAAVTALEYHCNRIGIEPTNLSTMFVHYNARQVSGDEGTNAGTTMQAAMKAIATYGACRETTWPFDPSKLIIKPPPHAYEEARKFAAIRAFAPADVIQALALRYPVPCVIKLPERCLREAGRTGVMPAPSAQEVQQADGLVNHSLVLVGYDRNARTYVARNCWGESWGDKGHCRISFEVLNVIAPQGAQRLWVIATAESGSDAHAAIGMMAPPPPAAAAPERLSDLAAKLRQEIRGDVQRDIADATTRIRDIMGRNAGVPPTATPQNACSRCGGNGKCWACGGRGCGACGNGLCPHCRGGGRE
jgi:hypothetical protein